MDEINTHPPLPDETEEQAKIRQRNSLLSQLSRIKELQAENKDMFESLEAASDHIHKLLVQVEHGDEYRDSAAPNEYGTGAHRHFLDQLEPGGFPLYSLGARTVLAFTWVLVALAALLQHVFGSVSASRVGERWCAHACEGASNVLECVLECQTPEI